MLKTQNGKRVILDVSSLPTSGESKYLYHNTTDGFFYYWNDVQSKFIKLENLNVITTVQPTPTTTGNTTNLNSTFKDANGDSWIVDTNGDAIKAGSSATIFKEQKQFHVDKNGNDTTGTGADENPFLTVTKALTTATATTAVIVNEGTYSETATLATPNVTLRGQGQEYGGLTEINSLAVTASGTSVRVSSLTVLGNSTHSGTSAFYLSDSTINGNYASSTTAYTEIRNSRIQSGTISKTAAGILFTQDSLIGNATFSTANSVISLRNVTIDAGKSITIGAGVIYALEDVVGNVVINAAAVPLETALLAQGLTALQAKLQESSTFNDIRLTNVNTITNGTKALVRDADGIVREQLFPTGGGSWTSATTDPTATGNTGTLPRFVENTSNGSKWYIDSTGVAKKIESNTVAAQVVYVNDISPATATIFDLENPPVTNDDSLKNLDTVIYIGTDGSTWNSNGTVYSTYVAPANTAWYLANTTTDAGGNKTGSIYRTGNTGININNPLNKFVVKGTNAASTTNGTAQSNATFRVDGDSNHSLDMGTLAASPFGSYVQSYNKASAGVLPLILNPTGGNVGVNTTNPVSALANTATSIQGSNTTGAVNGGLNWVSPGIGFVAAFYSQPATGNGLLVKVGGSTSANNLFEVSTGTQSSVPIPVIKALGDGNVGINNTNPTVPLDVINRGTGQYLPVARFLAPSNTVAGNNSQMVFGTSQGAGNCSDWRFFYSGNGSNNNRIDFGMSGRVTPMISYLYSGFTGINNTTPLSFLDVSGSFGALDRGSSVSTTTSGDHTVWMAVAGTTCTLEAPTAVRRRIMFIKNTSAGIVTVAGHIDGTASTNHILLPKESIMVQSDGTTWQILAKYASPTPLAVSTQLNQVTIPASTNTLLTAYTNVSDTSNGAWNAATGIFTCNKAGLYRFQFRAMFSINTWNQGNEVNAQFMKNGVNVNNASWFAASTYNQYAFSGDNVLTLNLVVGDTIQVRLWHNGPAGRQTYLPAYQIYTINEIR